jgi:hypothetical protein
MRDFFEGFKATFIIIGFILLALGIAYGLIFISFLTAKYFTSLGVGKVLVVSLSFIVTSLFLAIIMGILNML